jgi:SAM-dependent methyltransferase
MCPIDVNSIDWGQMWKAKLENSRNAKKEDWDRVAGDFERQYTRNDYSEKFLARMDIKPEFTVLDVGCGPANLAIPLSARVKSITGLDVSKEMLRLGVEKTRVHNISNITFSQFNWDDVVVGKDVEPHDVVICSRAFHSRSPKESLLKLNEAATKYVYLTLRTRGDEAQVFYTNLYRELGKEFATSPDYIYAYNILYQAGILAHVDFITYTDSFRYKDAQDVFRILSGHMRMESEEQKDKLMLFVNRNMAKNGEFRLDMNSCWALIWWQKKA